MNLNNRKTTSDESKQYKTQLQMNPKIEKRLQMNTSNTKHNCKWIQTILQIDRRQL